MNRERNPACSSAQTAFVFSANKQTTVDGGEVCKRLNIPHVSAHANISADYLLLIFVLMRRSLLAPLPPPEYRQLTRIGFNRATPTPRRAYRLTVVIAFNQSYRRTVAVHARAIRRRHMSADQHSVLTRLQKQTVLIVSCKRMFIDSDRCAPTIVVSCSHRLADMRFAADHRDVGTRVIARIFAYDLIRDVRSKVGHRNRRRRSSPFEINASGVRAERQGRSAFVGTGYLSSSERSIRVMECNSARLH